MCLTCLECQERLVKRILRNMISNMVAGEVTLPIFKSLPRIFLKNDTLFVVSFLDVISSFFLFNRFFGSLLHAPYVLLSCVLE